MAGGTVKEKCGKTLSRPSESAGKTDRAKNLKMFFCLLLLALTLPSALASSEVDHANDLDEESANSPSVLFNDNINSISTSDNNSEQEADSYFGSIKHWFSNAADHVRMRRKTCGVFDWFCTEKDDETTEASPTTSSSTATTPSEPEAADLIQIDTNDDDDDEEEHKRTRTTRAVEGVGPAKPPSVAGDDEDYVTQDDSSGDQLQGSGEVQTGQGVTPPTPVVIPGQPHFYRIVMKLHEPFRDEYLNRTSQVYQKFEISILEAFNELLKGLPGRQSVTLINVRNIPEDRFFLNITVDIGTKDFYDKQEILGRIRRQVVEKNSLGPYTTSGDFSSREFGADSARCRGDEVPCRSGECVDASQRCDGITDCKDGSDEDGCSGPPSTPGTVPVLDRCRADDKVRCEDGSGFICEDQVCDGVPDCGSGSDEEDCPPNNECGDEEFMCDVNRCIPGSSRCDGRTDCADATDELGCTERCRDDEFRCSDGKCIDYFRRCDYIEDCANGADEFNCPCASVEDLPCFNGTCVTIDKKCDGRRDCPLGDDEVNCTIAETTLAPAGCRPTEWRCDYGECIDNRLRCNRQRDCPGDDSDERDCPPNPDAVPCTSSQYTCKDGSCISGNLRCDKKPDCPDGGDEDNCPCTVSEFACDNGHCIPTSKVCDRFNNCQDGSDERDCKLNCSSGEYRCRDETACIAATQRCDRRMDCRDGSDEENCPRDNCPSNQFSCSDGTCLNIWQRCNGISECPGGEDERGCSSCTASQFACRDGRCINMTQHCDGAEDCSDGGDEQGCGTARACPDSDFACNDGLCVPLKFRCDGMAQCLDASDEQACPHIEPTAGPACGVDQFTCADGACISAGYVCDSIPDCPDKSDEANCKVTCTSEDVICGDGRCLSPFRKCDLYLDCEDGADEMDCGFCYPGDFRCKDGSCVPETKRCDGLGDCRDGSDEDQCVSSCRDDEWRCLSGLCLRASRRCDGRRDCPDGSDEEDCIASTSEPQCSEAQCDSGVCIPFRHVCDGFVDCLDNSDEKNCSTPRPPCNPEDEFTCGDGSCIPKSRLCDRRADCIDRTDEANCNYRPPPPPTCSRFEFTCGDRSCIDDRRRCDGRPDCPDGSDERDCGSCASDEWACDVTTCIHVSHKCDTIYDCRDFSDEQNCLGCRSDEFQCRLGNCIPSFRVCDGRSDCPDSSDEGNCTTPAPPTPTRCLAGEFACFSGDQCVPEAYHCDGRPDCRDQSDELNCALGMPCLPGYFRCENGPCISGDLRCNGAIDCPRDMSDELDCRPGAPRGLNLVTIPREQTIKEGREVVFQCRDEGLLRATVRWARGGGLPLPPGSRDQNGRLEIPNVQLDAGGTYLCEAVGYPRSTPGQNVSVYLKVEPAPSVLPGGRQVCGLDEATCNNWECIRKEQICDGSPDCRDGSDEVRCGTRGSCEPNQFQCGAGQCVRKDWLCDGQTDCMDGEDERECVRPTNSSCAQTEFECESRTQCVPRHMHCDGEIDCQDASDEKQCSKPIFVQVPPALITVDCRSSNILNITCTAVGGPVPVVSWRRNWGHIPSNCQQTCVNGVSHLMCIDVRESEQGAYSCEAYSSKGHIFASPDTQVLCRDPFPSEPCPVGTFNVEAVRRDDCINCFCFGKSTRCSSADLFTFQIPPPFTQYRIIGVTVAPDGSAVEIRPDVSLRTPTSSLRRERNGFQIYSRSQSERVEFSGSTVPYFVLPEVYQRNQLKSYGGYLNYTVRYGGNGRPIQAPDVIIAGNNLTLSYTAPRHTAGQEQSIGVRFWPRIWNRQGRRGEEIPASREDVMIALADVQFILIRAQYVDGEIIDTSVSDVAMDSAGSQNTGLGRSAYVEKCECPVGYQGLSCEECSPGFSRPPGGDPWRGECRREIDITCPAGTYGNPGRNIPCLPCPCPLTNPSNQFGSTCFLASDGQVTCNCPQGYTGRRCERCERGYTGNPNVPGDYCRPGGSCDPAGSLTADPDPYTGQCTCKDFATGPLCDRCQPNSFFLHESNPAGCINCFCSGVTRTCDSSRWYRDQVSAAFVRDTRGFKLEEADTGRTIDAAVHVDTQTRELVYQDFSPRLPQAYYWSLPSPFLGDKVTSYGGYLNYTLRYVPSPGGASSRNSNADVQLISVNDIKLFYFHRGDPVDPNRPQTVVVPLREQYWQRHDGQTTNREHFLMALSDLGSLLIKATYTTNTKEAAILRVSLDTAQERNTGQRRALEVEQCACPVGYRGLSCEDCDVGYTRSGEGLYLGTCEPCTCSNHSNECDPELGTCRNCRDGTTGENCDECLEGYEGNPLGEGCTPLTPDTCRCDPRGSVGPNCPGGQCQCKPNVVGANCDRCAYGYFGLAEMGACVSCFCSDVTQDCQSSALSKTQIPMQILNFDPNHGFTLSDNLQRSVIRSGFVLNDAKNEISYVNLPRGTQPLFWSLPSSFTGNKVTSYGGKLYLTQRFDVERGYSPSPDADVILNGNGVTLYWRNPSPLQPNHTNVYSVPLEEGQGWTRLDPQGPRTASRADLMTVLANLESAQVLATPFTGIIGTSLSDVALDTAVDHVTGEGIATWVEQCRCPAGYRGPSCEACATGYYRDTYDRTSRSAFGLCKKCPCSGREESCVLEADGRVLCSCRPGFTGRNCENEGFQRPDNVTGPTPPPPRISISISEPTIQIIQSGSTVRFRCTGRSLETGRPVNIRWTKDGGELPRGRAIDDALGTLVITGVQETDAGVYVCSASDGVSIATHYATLQVESQGSSPQEPQVEVSPGFREVREGDPVEFKCFARGVPLPELTWTHVNGLPLNPLSSFLGGVFTIPRARKSDEGRYACTGTNMVGQDTKFVQLAVRSSGYPPESPLRVTVEPPSYDGVEPGVLVFTCLPLSYNLVWSRQGGRSLPASASQRDGVLTFYNPTPADSGTYVCNATNTYLGTTGFNEISVNINSARLPPSVQIDPEEQTVFQGLPAEMRCLHRNSPNARVRWSRLGDEALPPGALAQGSTLSFSRLAVQDRGTYICTVETPQGTAQAMTRLEVEPREAPSVEIHPEAFSTVVEGGGVLVQCIITGGIPTPRLRWTRPSGAPAQSSSVLEEPNGVLRINRVSLADSGQYICHADNEVGSVSATATIEVLVPPTVNVTPAETATIVEGEAIRLECRASGKPAPTVSWLRYTINQSRQIYETRNITREEPLSVVYSVSSVTRADEGTYVCVAKNAAGSTQERVLVIVEPDNNLPARGDIPGGGESPTPQLPTSPQAFEYSVAVGGRTQMRCSVRDTQEAIYLDWKRSDGYPLPREHVVRDGVLFIDNAQTTDGGEYVCIGINRAGQILFRAAATLAVISPPRIALEPVRQIVRPGDNADIVCSATGDGPITIEWSAVGRALPRSAKSMEGYLTFRAISVDDAGKYLCTASSPVGQAEALAEVVVIAPDFNASVLAENRQQSTYVGASIQLRCIVSTDAGGRQPQVSWSREGAQLPPNSYAIGEVLRLTNVNIADSGRYICEISSPLGTRSSDFIDLTVNRERCRETDFHCVYGLQCIPRERYCDGVRHCMDGSDERNCRQSRETSPVVLSLQPSLDKVRPGDSLSVKCVAAGAGAGAAVSWNRVGQRFDSNTQAYGNVIRFNSVQEKNGGLYRCTAKAAGKTYTEDYILVVEADDVINDPPSAEVKSAPYGKKVELECSTDLEKPVTYTWQKQGGSLPKDSYTRNSWLVINDVRAQDAGSYVCHASSGSMKISVPIILVVTGVVPHFPQAPVSFMVLPTLPNANMQFDVEVSFKPDSPDGLILYNGQRRDGVGDFVSLGLNKGIVEFRFDVGSGAAVITSDRPLSLGQWHTVNISRVMKQGTMTVDGSGPFTKTAPGAFLGLDLAEPLYVGGVPDFSRIQRSTGLTKGLVGCISRVSIGGTEQDIVRDATYTTGVTTCETCAENPCRNRGVCQEAASKQGYSCLCPSGFSGDNCDKVGETCYTGLCGRGRCVNKPTGFQCICPFGLAGPRCQQEIPIGQPYFSGDAYIAYPTPKAVRRLKTSLELTPSKVEDGVILYTAAAESGIGEFSAIAIIDRRIEFRYDTGNGVQILRGTRDLVPGETVTVNTVRDGREARLIIDQLPPVTARSDGRPLVLRTPVYIGGYDKEKIVLASGVGTEASFQGCIAKVEIGSLDIHPIRSIVDAGNVEDCQIEREATEPPRDPCRRVNCLNGGICESQGGSYRCRCPSGYRGRHCEEESSLCDTLRPCANNATCEGSSSTYKCHCAFGFTGPTCTEKLDVSKSVSLRGEGYLELPRELLVRSGTDKNVIVIEFISNGGDGLLLWFGQDPSTSGAGQDYLSVGVQGGYLVLSYELGSGPAQIRSRELLTLNQLHKAILIRDAVEGTLQLDAGDTVFGESPEPNTSLNAVGNVFIGGAPDVELMTSGQYRRGFSGCIVTVELGESGHINFTTSVISSRGVQQCPKNNSEEDYNDEVGEDRAN